MLHPGILRSGVLRPVIPRSRIRLIHLPHQKIGANYKGAKKPGLVTEIFPPGEPGAADNNAIRGFS